MNFVKNIQFTCLVKCAGKQREFNFQKRRSEVVPFYTVDTVDLSGNRFGFNMDHQEDHWKIRESGLPLWILDVESQLSARIDEHDG